MEIDYYRSLQILALENVINSSEDYLTRFIMRWFAKTYCTPYHIVKAMPLEEIIQAFYENMYYEMDEEDRQKAAQELLETPEEKAERIRKEEAQEAALQRTIQEENSRNKKMEDVVPKPAVPVFAMPKEAELASELKNLIKGKDGDLEIKFANSDSDFEKIIAEIESRGHKKDKA